MKIKITKKWLKAHGWHDDCVSREVLYNDYRIMDKNRNMLKEPISGWYVFINDKELNPPPKKLEE